MECGGGIGGCDTDVRHPLHGPGPARGGGGDVLAGTARLREGARAGSYVDSLCGRQLGHPLQTAGPAGEGEDSKLFWGHLIPSPRLSHGTYVPYNTLEVRI